VQICSLKRERAELKVRGDPLECRDDEKNLGVCVNDLMKEVGKALRSTISSRRSHQIQR
jgi:hypothetical protein